MYVSMYACMHTRMSVCVSTMVSKAHMIALLYPLKYGHYRGVPLQPVYTGRTQKLPFQACAIKSDAWDWLNDEEAVLPGDHVQTPAPTWWLSATCNSSPQGSSGLLWPSKGTSCVWCTHVHAGKIATHIKNKINKILFMRKISRVKLYPPLS